MIEQNIIGNCVDNILNKTIRRMEGHSRSLLLAYVIFLSEDAQNHISRLQLQILDRYGANNGVKATPHITFKLGFNVKITCLQPFREYFDSLVAEINPFNIVLNDFGFFDEGIIFVDVKDNIQLKDLRQRVLKDLGEKFGIKPYPLEGNQFHFHVTLAHGLSKKNIQSAFLELKKEKIEFDFMAETLGMICYTENQWMTYTIRKLNDKK